MRILKQNWFKNLSELHKEWTEAGVKASRATTHRRVKEFGYSCRQRHLTWAKEKKNCTVAQWSTVIFSDESKFCISFGNQGPRVWRKGGEAHSPSFLKSSVKFPQSVMIWGAMSSTGVRPLCFFVNQHHCTRLPRNFGALHASFCWPAFQRCWFHFPAGFGTCSHCQKHQKLVKWPWCWCAWLASKLTRPEPHKNLWGIVKIKMRNKRPKTCRWAEGYCQRNLGFHTTSAVPQTDHLRAIPNWGSN